MHKNNRKQKIIVENDRKMMDIVRMLVYTILHRSYCMLRYIFYFKKRYVLGLFATDIVVIDGNAINLKNLLHFEW